MTPASRAWMHDAACATPAHRSLPWTTDTQAMPADRVSRMRAVCAGCPVAADCAAHAAATGVTGGFWAGHDRGLGSQGTEAAQLAIDLGGAA